MSDKINNKNEQSFDDELENQVQGEGGEVNFIQKYGKLIAIAAVAVVAIVAVAYYFTYTSNKNKEEAALALSRIRPYFDREEYARALFGGDSVPTVRGEKVLGLIQIVEEYSSTPSGRIAALLAGEAYLALDNISEARKYFEIAAKANSDEVAKGGYAGLAVCSEKNDNLSDAAKIYEKAAELAIDPTSKGRYLLFAGICYARMNEKDRAIEHLTMVAKNRDFAEFANAAKIELARLGTIIE